ncbi:MAG: hypothetical protein IJ230_06140 [Clostridia bacterium]|nr:hypothetical protein [Clostridia bacterium]
MTTATATARQKAIRLSQKVRENPDLAKSLGIRVDFKTDNNDQDREAKTEKGCQT